MITKRIYRLKHKDSIAFVKTINRYTIEEAFEVFDDASINEVTGTSEIGFLNDKGDFLNPTDALKEALECNQINDFMKMVIEKNGITNLQSSYLDNYNSVID